MPNLSYEFLHKHIFATLIAQSEWIYFFLVLQTFRKVNYIYTFGTSSIILWRCIGHIKISGTVEYCILFIIIYLGIFIFLPF
jgi:hypothetical protein